MNRLSVKSVIVRAQSARTATGRERENDDAIAIALATATDRSARETGPVKGIGRETVIGGAGKATVPGLRLPSSGHWT